MLSGPSFRLAFVFSINSLILSGFPLTSEPSLSAFSWLYTLVCAFVQIYHEMSFIYNYSHFSTHFAINPFYLHNLKAWTIYGATTAPCMWTNEIKTKTKTKSRHIQIDHAFDLAHKQWHGIIKGGLHCLTLESKEDFLSIIY